MKPYRLQKDDNNIVLEHCHASNQLKFTSDVHGYWNKQLVVQQFFTSGRFKHYSSVHKIIYWRTSRVRFMLAGV